MKNFAFLDNDNVVLNISLGQDDWLKEGWISCPDFCGIGSTYNKAEDIFITPQPYPSWTREGSFWNAPVEYPSDGKRYSWNEENQSWDLIGD